MSVEEDVSIRILHPRKLDSEARKAIGEMEKIRKRLESEAKKADKAVDQIKGAPTDIQNLQPGRGGTPGKILPSSNLVKGIAPILKKSNPFKDLVAKVNKNAERQEKLEAGLDKATEKIKEASDFASNPLGFLIGKGRGGIPPFLLKGGIIGAIIFAVGKQIFEEVKRTFGPGGVNDIRKQVLDETATIPDLENLIAIRNGSVYFTADVRVRQRVAQTSNTEDLDFQSQRFNEFALGREISST